MSTATNGFVKGTQTGAVTLLTNVTPLAAGTAFSYYAYHSYLNGGVYDWIIPDTTNLQPGTASTFPNSPLSDPAPAGCRPRMQAPPSRSRSGCWSAPPIRWGTSPRPSVTSDPVTDSVSLRLTATARLFHTCYRHGRFRSMRVILCSVRSRLGARDGFTMIVALGIMLVVLLISALCSPRWGPAPIPRAIISTASAPTRPPRQVCRRISDSSTRTRPPRRGGRPAPTTPRRTSRCPARAASPTPTSRSSRAARAPARSARSSIRRSACCAWSSPGRPGSDKASRTIVADFQPTTPLAFLWYTVHETVNPTLSTDCPGSTSNPQTNFYANSTVPADCQITWVTGDAVKRTDVYPGRIPRVGHADVRT